LRPNLRKETQDSQFGKKKAGSQGLESVIADVRKVIRNYSEKKGEKNAGRGSEKRERAAPRAFTPYDAAPRGRAKQDEKKGGKGKKRLKSAKYEIRTPVGGS